MRITGSIDIAGGIDGDRIGAVIQTASKGCVEVQDRIDDKFSGEIILVQFDPNLPVGLENEPPRQFLMVTIDLLIDPGFLLANFAR